MTFIADDIDAHAEVIDLDELTDAELDELLGAEPTMVLGPIGELIC